MKKDRERQPTADFFSREITGARRFYLNLGPATRGPMAVAAGGWEACAPGYRVSRPEFPFFSIEYVVAGRGEVTLNGRTHPLAVGSVFSYGPGVAHTIVSDREDRLEKYFVDFQGRDSVKAMAGAGLAPGSCGAVLGASRITTVFAELVSLGSSAHAESGRGAALALELLLLAIAQERAGAEAIGAARASFDKCQAQLQGNYLNLQTVNELAEACHLDPAYVCRLYRRFLGQTPYRCLVRRRMEWVAERLVETGRQVRSVADQLGMDPFQLSRTFRRTFGLSPTEFMRLRRG